MLNAWADAGAPAGNEADAPAPLTFNSGWNIKPDLIVEMPKPFELPARGTINYKYILVKTNFPEDMWITAAEMRPGDPAVLHHGKVWVRPPGSKWMENAVPGEAYESESNRDILGRNAIEEGNDILGKFNPGLGAQSFDIEGAAKFVPKGSDVVFELHYTTSGKPASDVSKLGLVLAKSAPQKRYFFHAGTDGAQPGDSSRRGLGRSRERDHVRRGRTAGLRAAAHASARQGLRASRRHAVRSEPQTVLRGNFNFEWQMGYQYAEPIALPKGSKLQLITHFDNSTANRFNPDPAKKVVWGPQNWDEMSNCFIGVLFDTSTAPEKVFLRSGPSMLPRGEAGPTLAAFNQASTGVAAATNGNINANVAAPATNGGPGSFER